MAPETRAAGGQSPISVRRALLLAIAIIVAAVFFLIYPRFFGSGAGTSPATGSGSVAPNGAPANVNSTHTGSAGAAPVAVIVAVAARQTIPITNTSIGLMEAVETVVVRTRADGLVLAQPVIEGQLVKAGDVLLKLDDLPAQAVIAKDQAQIAKDQATAASANADLAGIQSLATKQVDSQQQLYQAQAAAKVAESVIGVDQAQLQTDQLTLGYMTITAAIDGRVGTVNTSVGNIVHAADTSADGLLTITKMSTLRASFSVAERDLRSFRTALAKNKSLPVQILIPGDTKPIAIGTLAFIDSSVDPTSGTLVVKADVDNSARQLWPGEYVSAVTQLGAYTDATTVPLIAVQAGDSGAFVFAVGADQKVKKQPVTVVATVDDTAVLGPEIKPGDHVVVEGQLRLADGSSVKQTIQGPPDAVAASQTSTPPQTSSSAVGGTPVDGDLPTASTAVPQPSANPVAIAN